MEIINNANCKTCGSNIPVKTGKHERVCEVFNLPLDMYVNSTSKYGCNSYVKDVTKMEKLPEKTKIKGRDYILWDVQYSKPNAELSCELVSGRIPRSVPEILMLQEENKEPVFGVYVKEVMSDDS